MTSTEKILASVGLWVSISGVVWALFILLAAGMSNVAGEARKETFVAFPPAVLALMVSLLGLSLAFRKGTARGCARTLVPAIVISGGTILLIIAALRTYR